MLRQCGPTGLVLIAAAAVLLAGCAPSRARPGATYTQTRTEILTAPASVAPVAAGPTTTAAGTCPLLSKTTVADDLGMRLDKENVLTSGGQPVGCEFFAIQDSPLATSERLPGPNQPVLRITSTRYASAVQAHNAMVLAAQTGINTQQITVKPGNVGLAFQTEFDPQDQGTDWACAFTSGTTLVLIHTVVTSPALNAIEVAQAVAARF